MTAGRVPERIAWAVETMAIRSGDRLLEIGSGPGVAVALIATRWPDVSITAIDRSATAVAATRARTRAAGVAGRVVVEAVALEDADFAPAAFDTVFAVNVNRFWVADPAAELAAIRRWLAPRGTLHLFYETPSAARLRSVADAVEAALEANGFDASRLTTTRGGRALAAIVGRTGTPATP